MLVENQCSLRTDILQILLLLFLYSETHLFSALAISNTTGILVLGFMQLYCFLEKKLLSAFLRVLCFLQWYAYSCHCLYGVCLSVSPSVLTSFLS